MKLARDILAAIATLLPNGCTSVVLNETTYRERFTCNLLVGLVNLYFCYP
jgi:hypothetical protein